MSKMVTVLDSTDENRYRLHQMRTIPALLAVVALLVASAGCGSASGANGRKTVVAAFYPLAFAAERGGGSTLVAKNMTPPGTETHDIELTQREVAQPQD